MQPRPALPPAASHFSARGRPRPAQVLRALLCPPFWKLSCAHPALHLASCGGSGLGVACLLQSWGDSSAFSIYVSLARSPAHVAAASDKCLVQRQRTVEET